MRAAEEHHQHDEQTRQLLRVLERRTQDLASVMAVQPDGVGVTTNYPIAIDRNEDVMAAREAVAAAQDALGKHVMGPTNFVRNYRILNPQDGAELERFTADYEVAPWTASKRMAARQIQHYALQEQQPDGAWLPYHAF